MIPEAALLDRLSRARLIMHHARATVGTGDRQSNQKGPGVDFASYRPFQEGDDIRKVDPRVLARLGDRYVREHYADRQLPVYVIVDFSKSMAAGRPGKLDRATSPISWPLSPWPQGTGFNMWSTRAGTASCRPGSRVRTAPPRCLTGWRTSDRLPAGPSVRCWRELLRSSRSGPCWSSSATSSTKARPRHCGSCAGASSRSWRCTSPHARRSTPATCLGAWRC